MSPPSIHANSLSVAQGSSMVHQECAGSFVKAWTNEACLSGRIYPLAPSTRSSCVVELSPFSRTHRCIGVRPSWRPAAKMSALTYSPPPPFTPLLDIH